CFVDEGAVCPLKLPREYFQPEEALDANRSGGYPGGLAITVSERPDDTSECALEAPLSALIAYVT
ncbi:MAG: hypothetical protein AAGA87_11845, partial [Pseudomonadota bacterium]